MRISGIFLPTTLHLDPESARILGMSWRGRLNSGVTSDVVETFTDWSTVNGVLTPRARTLTLDGKPQPGLAREWSAVDLLGAMPDGFLKPQRR